MRQDTKTSPVVAPAQTLQGRRINSKPALGGS
jgi:hypothetical protein